jgi:pimeloyl-ACP methyl ester carboxylesterase
MSSTSALSAAAPSAESNLPRELTFEVFGRTLAALAWGDPAGTPTIALHGWLDNANTFNRLAPLLPELRIVALDFAGHGRSSHLPPGCHYHGLFDIQDVLAVADQLGWERFNLIGHSMGAGISSELAGLFPERVIKAVMIDGFLATGGADPRERINSNREALLQMLHKSDRQPRSTAIWRTWSTRVTQATDQSAAAARELVERGHKPVAGGYTWRTDPRIRFNTPLRMPTEQIDELMRRTTAPGLLIVARQGDRWYRSEVEARKARHPDLTVVEMDGPHHIHLEPDHCEAVAAIHPAVPGARRLNPGGGGVVVGAISRSRSLRTDRDREIAPTTIEGRSRSGDRSHHHQRLISRVSVPECPGRCSARTPWCTG